eukprot:TRINITY_DN23328_c0_g1_i1.p1 TRINITY_DN23328_c0_g1~~TRINITY_DN23328_c0_g1_i1.p1  ORF type:complete len:220 (+),score=30.86 TRINITY_DN23328_c0_g1_i1:25-660(+)
MAFNALAALSSMMRARQGLGWLTIIAVQFGIQPILTKHFVDPRVVTSSLVLCQELSKIAGCLLVMFSDGTASRCFRNWSCQECLVAAGVPSVTYLVQNFCVQLAYKNLDPVAFNVLNQSKVLFTALFSFLISGRMQSRLQCFALVQVTVAGILVSMPKDSNRASSETENRSLGLLCVTAAAGLSGLGSGITEWALQKGNRALAGQVRSTSC